MGIGVMRDVTQTICYELIKSTQLNKGDIKALFHSYTNFVHLHMKKATTKYSGYH